MYTCDGYLVVVYLVKLVKLFCFIMYTCDGYLVVVYLVKLVKLFCFIFH